MADTRTGEYRSVFEAPAFVATLLAFGLFGFLTGVWEVLLADLRTALSLSAGAFGASLTAGFVGAPLAMVLGGRVVDRFGPRLLVGASGVVMGVALLGLSRVGGYGLLVGIFVVFFGANSAYDVGINAAGIGVEQTNGQQVMAYFHAAFSAFAALGALLAGALLAADVDFRIVYAGLAVGVAIGAALLLRSRALPDGRTEGGSTEPGSTEPESTEPTGSDTSPESLYRNGAVVLVAGIVALGYFAEGTIENWSAVYLRTWLTFPAVVGASGVALFHAAMATGRLGGARLIPSFDRRLLLRAAGALGAIGMLIALATTSPAAIFLGLFVVGLSTSVVSPIGYSLAGDLAPGRSGEASSVVTLVGWSAFIVSPALIGGLGELVGLRLALATVVVTAGSMALLAARVPDRVVRNDDRPPSK